MKSMREILVASAIAVFAFGCFGSGGSDGNAGDGAMAGMGAGTNGASGMDATAGMGAGGTGIVTGGGGSSGGGCGICSVPACAPGETPYTPPGGCCPSCGIVGGGGAGGEGGAGGTGGDSQCVGKPCGEECTWVSGGNVQQGQCDPSGQCFPGDPVCNIENTTDCSCPDTPPTAGSTCEPCADIAACTYNDCAGTGRTVAQCVGDAWQVTTEACDVLDCEGFKCGDGVCLLIQGQAGGERRCADDPCTGSVLTCECAASLCTGEWGADACRISAPNQVSCYATSSGCTPDGICPP